jgi:vacuolar-type H+-ATPase subunit C/Vma6
VNDDYGYINARIRGMKTRLLDKPFFEKLMGEENIHSIIALLQGTDYGQHVEEARTLVTSEIAAIAFSAGGTCIISKRCFVENSQVCPRKRS